MFGKAKKPAQPREPQLLIQTARDFSEVAIVQTDEHGNRSEKRLFKDGSVKVSSLIAADLYLEKEAFQPRDPAATQTIREIDAVLETNKRTVTRFMMTRPHLPKEEGLCLDNI